MGARILKWIEELPTSMKALAGFVTAAVAFVVLARNNFALIAVILGMLAAAALVASLLRVALTKSRRGPGPIAPASKYKYPKHRPYAFAGVAVVALACALLLALRPTRSYIYSALTGSEAAPAADVLIAQFGAEPGSRPFAIQKRLTEDLQKELDKHGLDRVTASTISTPVTTREQAQAVARECRCKIVVWGWYDSAGIRVHLYLPERAGQDADSLSLRDLSWEGEGGASSDLSFKLGQQLPEDVTFLSLFVIGNLYYLENKYQEGHRVFDAAMANIPREIDVENKSILHFFNARSLEAAGADDPARVICEYSEAVALNRHFAAALNNLGIYTSKFVYNVVNAPGYDDTREIEYPADSMACMRKAGYPEQGMRGGTDGAPDYFLREALSAEPDSAAVKYNLLAHNWQLGTDYSGLEDETGEGGDPAAEPAAAPTPGGGGRGELETTYLKELEGITRKDPTIPGAHVLLGVLAFREKDASFTGAEYETALGEFSAASKLVPRSAELHVNLGKVHMRGGRMAEARAEFDKALSLAPQNAEAHLAAADVALREGQAGAALRHLDRIKDTRWEDRIDLTAAVLRSRARYAAGDAAGAAEALRAELARPEATPAPAPGAAVEGAEAAWDGVVRVDPNDPSVLRYLLGLLQAVNADAAGAAAQWKECHVPTQPDGLEEDRGDKYLHNDTATTAWYDLLLTCGKSSRDVSRWGAPVPCLPAQPAERLARVYDLVQNLVAHRIYYRRAAFFAGKGCPYVYTAGPSGGDWLFDTTVIRGLDAPSREAAQVRPLARFDGRLLIREVEPEVSHLDEVSVAVVDGAGVAHVLRPRLRSLRARDGDYLVLHRGAEVVLHFEGFGRIANPARYFVRARGFYVPLGRAPRVAAPGG
jgi:tetratricopeptide (TPR) repeat protein